MGQYFRIVNLDKKEWIEPDGRKLWELCTNNSIRMLGYLLATNNWDGTHIARYFYSRKELEELEKFYSNQGLDYDVVIINDKDFKGYVVPRLKYFGRWCGDRIAVVGDYADSPLCSNYKVGVTGPSYEELKKNPEWKNITEDVIKEFNLFIEDEDLKVKSCLFIRPGMIIGSNGFINDPIIKIK